MTDPTLPGSLTIIDATKVVGRDTPLSVTFSLAATGQTRATDLRLRIGVSDNPVATRQALDEVAADSTRTVEDYPDELAPEQALRDGAVLAAPSAEQFTVGPFDVSNLVRNRPAVYPMRIGVSGLVDGVRQTVAYVHTYLVTAPTTQSTASAPTPVSVLVTLADTPRLRSSDLLLTDNDLADLVAPGGRLYELLNAVLPAAGEPRSPAALALEPSLLEALGRMAAGPYSVATPGGRVDFDRPNDDAVTFLDKLRQFARADGKLIALPYADADVAAMLSADNRHTAFASVDVGRTVVREVLGADVPVDTTVAYLSGSLVEPSAGSLLHDPGFGFQTLVMDDRLAAAEPGLAYTPASAFDVPTQTGWMRLLAVDHDLVEAVAFPSGGTAVALQTVLAELAVVTAERPSEPRPQLVALPHDWNPPSGWAAAVTEVLLAPSPVATPVGLGLLTAPVEGETFRSVGAYPEWAMQAQLSAGYLDGIDDIWAQAYQLVSVTCGAEPATDPGGVWAECEDRTFDGYQRALLRASSVFWRNNPGPGELIGQQVLSELNNFRNGIQVVASRIVTLTSNSGRVPVTVENNTAQPVNVVLALSSTDPARLRSPSRVERTIPPEQKIQVEIDVDAQSAGTFPVDIRLLTPAGEPLTDRPAVRVLVRSSAYGMIAIAITVGAVAVLFLAVVVRTARRLRGRRSAAKPDGTTTDTAVADRTTDKTADKTAELPAGEVADQAADHAQTAGYFEPRPVAAAEAAPPDPSPTVHDRPWPDDRGNARDRWLRGEPPPGPVGRQSAEPAVDTQPMMPRSRR